MPQHIVLRQELYLYAGQPVTNTCLSTIECTLFRWTIIRWYGSIAYGYKNQPFTSFGSGEHPYFPRGCGRISETRNAVFRRQGFVRDAAAGAEGLLSRADSVFAAACRHDL